MYPVPPPPPPPEDIGRTARTSFTSGFMGCFGVGLAIVVIIIAIILLAVVLHH